VRVAVIADTHLPRGRRRLPEACTAELRQSDAILHAGDLTGVAFLGELLSLGPPVHAIHGNADEPAVCDLLPGDLTVEVAGLTVALVHIPGPRAGREERLRRRFPDADAIVYGHTHVPQVERFEGAWILNPGSPTERRRSPSRAMLRLDLDRRRLRPHLLLLA
jgi:putative phosphoesterase